MSHYPTHIYQVAEIRELEKFARDRFGVSSSTLMQRAGKAAYDYLKQQWPHAKSIVVLCGMGNNGGDGYVLARLAHERHMQVHVLQVGNVQKLKNEALEAYAACKNAAVSMHHFNQRDPLPHADVIVDALCGTGFSGRLTSEAQSAILAMNEAGVPLLSMDIPSGVDADTGSVPGVAVQATATITYIGLKLGLLTGRGLSQVGQLVCEDLQLPAELYPAVSPVAEKCHREQYASFLKPRPRDWHKGNAGHVLVVGGEQGYIGAPRMAAEAALRVGAGLVTVATHPKHAPFLNLGRPEIMCHGVVSSAALKKLLNKATVVVVGPGLGQSLWSKKMLKTVLQSAHPLVVDADALNLLAAQPLMRKNWILTPHPGEAARLLQQSSDVIQQNRLTALQSIQRKYNGIVVLKGAGTLILAPDTLPALCGSGNPGMATAGMGDVLSGILGGLVAQGIPLADAAPLGVSLHAEAGDLAAQAGERGMVALDLMPYLRVLIN